MIGDAENAEVENAGVGDRGGKCMSDNGWKAVRKKVGPIRYQRMEQSIMIGYCDNCCKDTKAVPE